MNLFHESKKILDKDGKVNPLGPYGKQKLTGREVSTYFRRNKVKDPQIKKAVEVALDLQGAMSVASSEIKKFYGDKILKSKEVQSALKYANESVEYDIKEDLQEVSLGNNMLRKDFPNVWATRDAKIYRVLFQLVNQDGFVDNAKAYKKNPKDYLNRLRDIAKNPKKYEKSFGRNFAQYINNPKPGQAYAKLPEKNEFDKNPLKGFPYNEELQKNIQEEVRSVLGEAPYDKADVKKVHGLEKKLRNMLKEVDKVMRGSGLSAPAFYNVRSGISKGITSIEKFYKIANTKKESINETVNYHTKISGMKIIDAMKKNKVLKKYVSQIPTKAMTTYDLVEILMRQMKKFGFDKKEVKAIEDVMQTAYSSGMKKESINEVTDKEINMAKKLSKDMEKVKKGYQQIAKSGDKTLKSVGFNPTYEAILKAQQKVLSLIGELNTMKMMSDRAASRQKDSKGRPIMNSFDAYRDMQNAEHCELIEDKVLKFTKVKDKSLEKHLKVVTKKVGAKLEKISGGFAVSDTDMRGFTAVVDYIFDKSIKKNMLDGGGMSDVNMVSEGLGDASLSINPKTVKQSKPMLMKHAKKFGIDLEFGMGGKLPSVLQMKGSSGAVNNFLASIQKDKKLMSVIENHKLNVMDEYAKMYEDAVQKAREKMRMSQQHKREKEALAKKHANMPNK